MTGPITGIGASGGGEGVRGESHSTWAGVTGIGPAAGGEGVHGEANSGWAAVAGYGKAGGPGVWGIGGPHGGEGVHGESNSGFAGVGGYSRDPAGSAIWGENTGNGPGVTGKADHNAGVVAQSANGTGIVATGGTWAAEFHGRVLVYKDVVVQGDVVLQGADYAEAFAAVMPDIELGSVVVVGPDGRLQPCARDYDTSVAGVVSGAGGVKPALVLDRQDDAVTVALMGKVWAHADAGFGPIRPGDLLTTSATGGHCRRVDDPGRAFGAVIGKALTALEDGRGLVRVLVGNR